MYRRSLLGFIALCAGIAIYFSVSSPRLLAGTKVILGEPIPTAQQVSIDRIDHRGWDALLQKYCDENGYVAYQSWHASPADLRKLDQYLAHLSTANPNLPASQANKFAFWINAYNAVTIKGILRDYPVKSIKDLESVVFGYKIWSDLLLPVGDETYSLDNMEHAILRKMGDPRVHFALVCASISCPPLLNHAYTGEKLDAQLTANGKKFFANPQNFRVDGTTLYLSKLFRWYGGDFGADQGAQLKSLAPYMPSQAAKELATSDRVRVRYLDYDWNLNDQKSPSGKANQK